MSSGYGWPNRGPAVLAVATVSLGIASVFVFARLLCRTWIVRKVTLDDYFIFLGWIIAVGLTFTIDFATSKGLGRFDVNIPNSSIPSLRRCEYAFSVLYNPALMITKTSILIFFLRLSKNTNKFLRIGSYVTLFIVNVAGLVLTFLNIFQCMPIRSIFDGTTASTCIPLVTLYLTSAPVNIITDLAILSLPLPVLTSMRLPPKQKNILVFTFALGVFVIITDVIRIFYLQQASSNVAIGFVDLYHSQIGGEVDFAWYASLSLMWTAVEVNVGIICACIPTLKPLFLRFLPKLIDKVRTRTEHTNTNQSASQNETKDEGSQSAPSDPIAEIQPLPPVADPSGGQEKEMDLMDFLTVPGMDPSQLNRTKTVQTLATVNTVHFGFINMKRPRSMLKTKSGEAWKYGGVVTVLFFLWGFSYGLLAILNAQISDLSNSSTSQFLSLQCAYFGGYLVEPLTVGQYVLRHGGFKYTFISGLCIYATGTLMFWPSANLISFPGFVVSNFVVGYGLAVLETAANPFLALCGPPDYNEMRLLLAQGVQGIGSVVSPLLAEKVLFVNIHDNDTLIDVEWTYLAIALFDVALALFFYYMPLPEATDEDLHMQTLPEITQFNQTIVRESPPNTFMGKYPVIVITLILGVSSQFFYISSQESLTVWFTGLLSSVSATPSSDLSQVVQTTDMSFSPANYLLVGRTAFTISRFLAAFLTLFIRPRYLLLLFFVGDLIFSILTFALSDLPPDGIAAIVIVLFFFEGPLWPLIFSITLRGQGARTKIAAACLTASGCGGAIFPWVMYAVQVSDHKDVQYSHCVLIALSAAGTIFPLWLCINVIAGRQIDPKHGHKMRMRALLALCSCFRRKEKNDAGDGKTRQKRRKSSDAFLDSALWSSANENGHSKTGRSANNSVIPKAEHREELGITTAQE